MFFNTQSIFISLKFFLQLFPLKHFTEEADTDHKNHPWKQDI